MIPKEFKPSLISPNYIIRKRLLQNIHDLAPRLEGRLMDLGCGGKPYQSLFKVSEYIGVDYDNPGHPHTNEQIDVFYDGKRLPFENNSFDSVFSSEVFEHIFNLEEILAEIQRVLKPGGKLLFTCPFAFPEHEQPNDYGRYTSFAIKHLADKYGFRVIEYRKSGNTVEALTQLQLVYLQLHVIHKLRNIPVIRQAARIVVYGGMNIASKIASWMLPKSHDLYLNNIVLVEKI